VTVVEYGDFECPYCGKAEPVLRELLHDFTDVRYVWRHLLLTDVHIHAQLAAAAAETATEQGAFWEMHDLLLGHQDALNADDLIRHGEPLGFDVERFANDLRKGIGAARVADDVDLSDVNGTLTFFINGRRHYGARRAKRNSSSVEHWPSKSGLPAHTMLVRDKVPTSASSSTSPRKITGATTESSTHAEARESFDHGAS
jgi:predicted DsbA family dithiol-disulfide isomerase